MEEITFRGAEGGPVGQRGEENYVLWKRRRQLDSQKVKFVNGHFSSLL